MDAFRAARASVVGWLIVPVNCTLQLRPEAVSSLIGLSRDYDDVDAQVSPMGLDRLFIARHFCGLRGASACHFQVVERGISPTAMPSPSVQSGATYHWQDGGQWLLKSGTCRL